MPESDSSGHKKREPAAGWNTVARFLSRGGFTGRLESLTVDGVPQLPTEQELSALASRIAVAAREDPIAFGVLGAMREEGPIYGQLAGAVEAIGKDGDSAALSESQKGTLEAIVLLVGRPALFMKNDNFELPTGKWEMLAPFRDDISRVAKAVGRIGVSSDYGLAYAGTGFAVAPGVVMTNRHVVEDFVARTASGWELDPSAKMIIDFKQEFGAGQKREFVVRGVLWIDERDGVDLALLNLHRGTTVAASWPSPLTLQSDAGFAQQNNIIYVIGYPAADPTRNDAAEMQRIFEGVFEKKRISPGQVTSIDSASGLMSHDCSTLGGNSGSCVVDVVTNSVVGLHFDGTYLESNKAVLLPALAGHDNLRELSWRAGRDA